MKPIVSVVTPYRNAKRFLSRFVESIQNQTFPHWICIMVDDGSSDGGPELLTDLVANDPRFLLVNNTNLKKWPGPASARNCALSLVQTDYIAFCDVDDLWHFQKLERQLKFHTYNKLELTVSAYSRFIDGHLDQPPVRIVCPPAKLSLQDLFGHNPIPMLTVIISSDLALKGFSDVAHEDFLFWLTLFNERPSIRYGCLPENLAFYCIHEKSVSSQKAVMPLWAYRVFRSSGQSRVHSILYVLLWAVDHFLGRVSVWRSSQFVQSPIHELLVRPPLLLRRDESS